jgi:hypothetical protein
MGDTPGTHVLLAPYSPSTHVLLTRCTLITRTPHTSLALRAQPCLDPYRKQGGFLCVVDLLTLLSGNYYPIAATVAFCVTNAVVGLRGIKGVFA